MRDLWQPDRQEPPDGVPSSHPLPELQAARGASLSTEEDPGQTSGVTSGDRTGAHSAGRTRHPGRAATALTFAIAAAALLVDVVSKQLAVRDLTGREPVEVIGDFLQLRLVRNAGAAFSAGASLTPLISVVALVAAGVVTWYAFRVRHRGWAIALGLLLAGVTGNLLDRLFRAPGPFRGHVVDFFALPHWPVFNVADICIDLAGAIFVVLLLRGIRLDGERHQHDARRGDA